MLRPPVKWPGGKFYLHKWIIQHFVDHEIYLEACGGGASVLLNKKSAKVEIYNDIDFKITRFFRVLRDQKERFLERVNLIPYSEVEFNFALNYPMGAGELDMAICDFVRWRQSFGGQGKSWSFTKARCRGGMADNVNGWWSAIELLPDIINRISRVQITCQSMFDVIPKYDHHDCLIYLDPPYLHQVRQNGSHDFYDHEMSENQHIQLAALLNSCKSKVVLSGYPSPLYASLYSGWRVETKEIANHAAGGKSKSRETECLWMNYQKPK